MAFYLHGVHLPHKKATASSPAVVMPIPPQVTIPMSMHIGKPATPTVKVGDVVKVGTLIGEQNGPVSSRIYASVSGKVVSLPEITMPGGNKSVAVTIQSDGEMTKEELTAPQIRSREDIIEALRISGLVGLGGAGFPTAVKFNVAPEKIEELIVNGAECEPYITSDTLSMTTRTEEIDFALSALEKWLGLKKVIIGVEKQNARALQAMQFLAAQNPSVRSLKALPNSYPQGGEKVLIYHTTKKIVKLGQLPIDVGCIVTNCSSLAEFGAYLKTGMPLVEKCVTVDGGAIREPKNVIVPIGTSVGDLIEFCGGFKEQPYKVLYGGPMMGIALPNLSLPIMKNHNGITALTKSETKSSEPTPCIRCGSCTNACPFGVAPAAIAEALEKKDYAAMDDSGANLCMECGCCSFVCPAHRPLVQTNKLAKAALRAQKAKEGNAK